MSVQFGNKLGKGCGAVEESPAVTPTSAFPTRAATLPREEPYPGSRMQMDPDPLAPAAGMVSDRGAMLPRRRKPFVSRASFRLEDKGALRT